jgi:hypothetical protein
VVDRGLHSGVNTEAQTWGLLAGPPRVKVLGSSGSGAGRDSPNKILVGVSGCQERRCISRLLTCGGVGCQH